MTLKIGTKVRILNTDSKICEIVRIDTINGAKWYKVTYEGEPVRNVFLETQLLEVK